MSECENCGVPDYWQNYGYLDRFCFNCKWDKQHEERKDLPEFEFIQYEPNITPVTKQSLESVIKYFTNIVENSQKDVYCSKQKLIDKWYKFCSEVAESHDLETGIKYYELMEPYPTNKQKG